ncbi:hypothetical protein CLOM621_08657 [Clostridium sp. M62/1]|nr:hypothetical protein CLOM621_08657 [Clostridium sp. M62/1]
MSHYIRVCYTVVAPLAGAWIEISAPIQTDFCDGVAPLAGAWIEIISFWAIYVHVFVAPLAGAWIEISYASPQVFRPLWVAPLAGAWIEILNTAAISFPPSASLPSRERGLKSLICLLNQMDILSLPSRERGLKFARMLEEKAAESRRSPRGSVD